MKKEAGITMTFRVCIFAAFVATVMVQDARAQGTYYVATSGSDGSAGSFDSPWLTIARGVAQLRPGDVLYIRGGTYSGDGNRIDSQAYFVPSGTDEGGGAITISGYPGEGVVIRPDVNRGCVMFNHNPVSYVHVTDFDCDMSLQGMSTLDGGSTGIYLSTGSSYNVFERFRVHDNAAVGAGANMTDGNSHNNTWRDCEVDHNGGLWGVNLGYGFYLDSTDNVIEGCNIHHNGGYGVHVYNFNASADRNIVRNNRVWENGVAGGTNYGILYAQGRDGLIYNNLVYGNRGGIQVYSGSDAIAIYNNTVVNNGPMPGIALQFYHSGPRVEYNIVYGNTEPIRDYGGSALIDHNVTTNPGFTDSNGNSVLPDNRSVPPE